MRESIDLNADVGEGYDDAAIYQLVSSVNIACGAHAGDEQTMREAIDRAIEAGCAAGAHPGYADREGFGRRPMTMHLTDITAMVVTQVHDLGRVAKARGTRLRHVKPHGALYNQAAVDVAIAKAIATAVAVVDETLTLVGLAGSALIEAGTMAGLSVAGEAFCDRRYAADGTLLSREVSGAVITDPAEAAAAAMTLVAGERVQTLCIHADTPGALQVAAAVRAAVETAGVRVQAI